MRTKLFAGVAFAALVLPSAAYAQSTGSVEFDEGATIVVQGHVDRGVGGVQIPDSSKAQGTLNQAFIARQTPGNSILNTINSLPGVNFQNNDPFGSAGGTLTIRGFDASRISLTFDGVPLNDTGNYALFSNQQLDPELIEAVAVNYGSTDVDSPTAAASGSTVNYRTITPTKDFGIRVSGSAGEDKFMRIFALINTGEIGPWGTRMFVSASRATNDWFVNDFGKINKQQYNAKIYQPIGGNGDFVSIAVNYNQNRNNFGGSLPYRFDTNVFTNNTTTNGATPANPQLNVGAVRTPGPNSVNRFPLDFSEIPYHVTRCTVLPGGPGAQSQNTTVPTAPGPALAASGCGTTFDERYNPSNTGNLRISSRFTLAEHLVLTVEPSFQYVKANGGGTATAREAPNDIDPQGATNILPFNTANCTTVTSGAGVNCQPGYFGGNPFVGMDLNGDGDLLDQVNVLAASQTQTLRYGIISNLKWTFMPGQSVRVGFTYDYGRHHQTGEINFLQANGVPTDVFPVNNPIIASNGVRLEKRDRLSYAILAQGSGQYRGEFGQFTVDLGLRVPFFTRDLTNHCFTSSAGGFVECSGNAANDAALALLHPYVVGANGVPQAAVAAIPAAGGNPAVPAINAAWSPPQNRVYHYSAVLPSGGVTWKPGDHITAFVSYSRGLQVPGTDNLYNAFFFPRASVQANPVPETTDNIDAGVRYTTSKLQVQVGPWFTRFHNRLAGAFDPDTQTTVYRNLGTVDKYGIDGDLDWAPIPEVLVHAFGSYMVSNIKANVQIGTCPATLTTANTTNNCTVANAPIFALTQGKRESGAAVYSFGARVQGTLGPLDLGIQFKRTGPRYVNDQNLPANQCTVTLVNAICPTVANTPANYSATRGVEYNISGATAPAYNVVDLDARLNLAFLGLNKTTYLQLNVQNLFNQFYVGGFSGGQTSTLASAPFVQVGSPRTVIGTINVQF